MIDTCCSDLLLPCSTPHGFFFPSDINLKCQLSLPKKPRKKLNSKLYSKLRQPNNFLSAKTKWLPHFTKCDERKTHFNIFPLKNAEHISSNTSFTVQINNSLHATLSIHTEVCTGVLKKKSISRVAPSLNFDLPHLSIIDYSVITTVFISYTELLILPKADLAWGATLANSQIRSPCLWIDGIWALSTKSRENNVLPRSRSASPFSRTDDYCILISGLIALAIMKGIICCLPTSFADVESSLYLWPLRS